MDKRNDIRKIAGYVIPVFVFVLVAVLVFVFRSSLIPGWYYDGEDKFYLELPFTRASGIKTIGGKETENA